MYRTKTNIIYLLIVAAVFLLLKFGYTIADNNDLYFLLKPTDKLVGLLTGSHSIYLSDKGYFHEQLNIIIDKSCSGFNFWVLCFLVFTYLTTSYPHKTITKTLSIPTALAAAYIFTILVNTSRIFASIVVQTQTKNIFPNNQHIIHETIGIITNLTFLILAYILIDRFLIYKQHHEKLA